jgi:hypothetical protein
LRGSRLVKNSDDDNPIVVGVIEERIRKLMQQDSAECPMHKLKREWSFSSQRDRIIHAIDEVVG